MNDVLDLFRRWQLDMCQVLERMYRAPTPRERERWHALWLMGRGWSTSQVAETLGRDAHTIGNWLEESRRAGPTALAFKQTGGPPRPRPEPAGPGEGCGSGTTAEAGIEAANWNWKVLRLFIEQRFGHLLRRYSCLDYLHRLGFVLKRPKKRLLKADEAKREAFVAFYAALRAEAAATGIKMFFAD